MPKSGNHLGDRGYLIFALMASLVIVADQISKAWVRTRLDYGESIPVTSFFRISHVRNTGAAFGIFQDQSAILAAVSIAGIVLLLLLAFFRHHQLVFLYSTRSRIILGIVFGGIVGNLLDRLRFGYVTDFIDFGFWPAFNLADSSVVIGTTLLAYFVLFVAPKVKSKSD